MVALTAMTACKSGTREKFADTIPICFETDWGHTGAGGIFCSVEINGVKVDTVLVDNGCYRSDIDPDLAAKLDFTYRVYRTDTLRAKRGSEDLADIARYSVVTDSLCYKIGHTSFRLDTIDINKWAALMYSMPSLGATIGRDVSIQVCPDRWVQAKRRGTLHSTGVPGFGECGWNSFRFCFFESC